MSPEHREGCFFELFWFSVKGTQHLTCNCNKFRQHSALYEITISVKLNLNMLPAIVGM